jgi:membrane protein DedA with SNARE-associated domain
LHKSARSERVEQLAYFDDGVEVAVNGVSRPWPLPLLLVPIVTAMVLAMVGDVIGPTLINEHPLWQITINPRNRWMLLAAPQVDVWEFFVVGFARLVAIDPLFYVLGVQHGDRALRWAERKLGDDGGFVRKLEGGFGKAAPGIVLVAPNGYVCLLAGAAGMRARTFLALNVVGTLGRLALFRAAGEAFRDQLFDVLEFIQRYQWWLVAASLIVVSMQARRRRAADVEDGDLVPEDDVRSNDEDDGARPTRGARNPHGDDA